MDQEEDKEKKIPETESQGTATQEEAAAEPLDLESAEKLEEPTVVRDSPAEKRGRMVVAGLVATVVVSFIALLVAAIFQVTSRWLITCPTDLPVNDPAPILWKAMVSESATPFRLGVPGDMLKDAGFKGDNPQPEKVQLPKTK